MNMQRTLLAIAIAACGAVALNAQAASNPGPDGTINITGKVIAQTCQVNANGSGNSSGNVTLPDVFTTNLASAGAIAGNTPFTIVVSNCDASLQTVQAFWSGSNVSAADGNLTNTAAGGSNVEVQLLNASSAVMPLNGANATAQNSQVVNLSGGGATMNYSAQYLAKSAAATAGAVTTSVQFTMIYQ